MSLQGPAGEEQRQRAGEKARHGRVCNSCDRRLSVILKENPPTSNTISAWNFKSISCNRDPGSSLSICVRFCDCLKLSLSSFEKNKNKNKL